MAQQSRAFRIHQENDQIVARLETVEIPDPADGQVQVKVAYSSINYKDALAATGAGKIIRDFPRIGGIDLAGTVVKSADGRFAQGDPVVLTGYGIGENSDGGYTEYATVSADHLVRLPAAIDQKTAMAIGTAGFTAALSVHRLEQIGVKPPAGTILVTGATGGVGSMAIDMLAGSGYRVAAFTGKTGEESYLRALGASEIIDRNSLEMGSRPLEKGLWAGAVDSVGGDTLGWLTRTVQPWGAIASCGLAGGIKLETTVMPFIVRGVNLLGIDSVLCPMPIRQAVWGRLATNLMPKHLDSIVRTVSLDELPDQFDAFLKGTVRGRTVVSIGG